MLPHRLRRRLKRLEGIPVSRPPLDELAAGSYDVQLKAKVDNVWRLLERFLGGSQTQVFSSSSVRFRHKCCFGVWKDRETSSLGLSMPNPISGRSVEIRGTHFAASTEISRMMLSLVDFLNSPKSSVTFTRGLCTFSFYSTAGSESGPDTGLVSIGYNKKLDKKWLHEFAVPAAAHIGAVVVGRGPSEERVVAGPYGIGGQDYLLQWFEVDGTRYPQRRRDGIFVQCNIEIAQQMLRWAAEHVKKALSSEDNRILFEPYCGNGSFTLPLSKYYCRVLASDSAPLSVNSLRSCAEMIHIKNIETQVQDVVVAAQNATSFITHGDSTVLLNPPREGVPTQALNIYKHSNRILYVSCNPLTLSRDLETLRDSHRVVSAAVFDQFPFSDHSEVGVMLERIALRPRADLVLS